MFVHSLTRMMQVIILIRCSEWVSIKIMHFIDPSITVIKKIFGYYRNEGERLMINFMHQGTLRQTCQKCDYSRQSTELLFYLLSFIFVSFKIKRSHQKYLQWKWMFWLKSLALVASVHGAETSIIRICWPLLIWEFWWHLLSKDFPTFNNHMIKIDK